MIRLAIVEDELLVRVGIKMIIEDNQSDIHVVGAFSNAADALEFFKTNTADILVTDINLSGMNGIELIKLLKENGTDMLFIILSCFAKFEYAREAFELGVDKYVLKHEIKEEELIEIIHKVYNERKKNIHHYSNHDPSDDDWNETLKYRIAIITVKNNVDNIKNILEENIDFSSLEKIVNEISTLENLVATRLNQANGVVCTFAYSYNESESEINRSFKVAYEVVRSNLNNYFNVDIFFSTSKTFSVDGQSTPQDCSFNDLYKKHYTEALSISDYSFYCEKSCIIDSKDFDKAYDRKIDLNIDSDVFFVKDWVNDIQKVLEKYILQSKEEKVHPNHVRIQIDKCINKLISYVEHISDIEVKNLFAFDNYPSYLVIENIVDAKKLLEWVIYVINEINRAVVKNSDSTITSIKSYIDNNIDGDVRLTEIASEFHMTPTYFCKYFKKCTDMTYINYLNSKRVDKAKEYLATTDYSISEIANFVGIDNTNYFFRMFKKLTGKTASNYRKEARM